MKPNDTFNATVVMENDGTTTWASSFGMALADRDGIWTYNSGYNISGSVTPGNRQTFNLSVKAPSTTTTHTFRPGIFLVFTGTLSYACANAPPNNPGLIVPTLVVDGLAPAASVTSPANGATVAGNTTINVNASDSGGSGLDRVEFWLGSTKLASDSTSPYAYAWPTTSVSNGSKTLTIKAIDKVGNTAQLNHNLNVNNVSITPPPPPSPPGTPPTPPNPPGTPPTPPNPPGSPPTNPGTKPGNNIRPGSGATTPPAVPDTTPPSPPGNFVAQTDQEQGLIALTWEAASDNVAVIGYSIERSTDNQTWEEIESNSTSLEFDDVSTSFDKDYYYRIRSFDAAGNKSGYASADAKAPIYKPNVLFDEDSFVESEDGIVKITVKSGTLFNDALCNLTTLSGVTDIENRITLAGPYEFSCRDEEGNSIEQFSNGLIATIQRSNTVFNGVKDILYHAQGSEGWEVLSVQTYDEAANTDTIELGQNRTFVITGKQTKKSNTVVTIILVIIMLAAVVIGVRFVVMYLLKQKAQREYDEYLKKTQGL